MGIWVIYGDLGLDIMSALWVVFGIFVMDGFKCASRVVKFGLRTWHIYFHGQEVDLR